jgi:hypothetical protein
VIRGKWLPVNSAITDAFWHVLGLPVQLDSEDVPGKDETLAILFVYSAGRRHCFDNLLPFHDKRLTGWHDAPYGAKIRFCLCLESTQWIDPLMNWPAASLTWRPRRPIP